MHFLPSPQKESGSAGLDWLQPCDKLSLYLEHLVFSFSLELYWPPTFFWFLWFWFSESVQCLELVKTSKENAATESLFTVPPGFSAAVYISIIALGRFCHLYTRRLHKILCFSEIFSSSLKHPTVLYFNIWQMVGGRGGAGVETSCVKFLQSLQFYHSIPIVPPKLCWFYWPQAATYTWPTPRFSASSQGWMSTNSSGTQILANHLLNI